MQKIISKPVVGIGGIAFVTDTGMPVFAYKGEIEVNACTCIQKWCKTKWKNDSSHSTFCVPFNHIRPMSGDDELKDDDIAKEEDLKKTITW